jgi:hypothetical protein
MFGRHAKAARFLPHRGLLRGLPLLASGAAQLAAASARFERIEAQGAPAGEELGTPQHPPPHVVGLAAVQVRDGDGFALLEVPIGHEADGAALLQRQDGHPLRLLSV